MKSFMQDDVAGFEKIRKGDKKPKRQDSKRISKEDRKKIKKERKQRKMDMEMMEQFGIV